MTGFARRPLALFVCCLFAGVQIGHAAVLARQASAFALQERGAASGSEQSALSADPVESTPPLRLRMERRFNLLVKPKAPEPRPYSVLAAPVAAPLPDDDYPLFVIADNVEGRADDVTDAEGDVELRKTGMLLFADKVRYWPLDDELDARGNVRLLQDGVELETPHLRMKLSEQIGFAEDADYHFVRDVDNRFYVQQQIIAVAASSNLTTSGAPMMLNVPASYGLPVAAFGRRQSESSGHAERIDFEGEGQVRMHQATYSTCKPGRQDWYLDTAETHLDYDRDQGDATHAALWFKGVPVFYSPVATFSLNNQRHSGFLHPFWSASTKSGLDLNVPYYWAIAPNYEVTFYPRYLSKRGVQIGADAQYLDYNYRGSAKVEFMPKDEVLERERHAYNIQHTQTLGRGFSAAVNWQGVSDNTYWVDMSSRMLQTSQTQLPRQLTLGYAPLPWLQGNVQVLRYQTLQPDPANPIARPYFLEPQLNLFGYRPNLFKTDFSMVGQYTRFTHDDVTNRDRGERMVFYPQFTLPVINPAYQITPKIGLHMTSYALDRATVNAGLTENPSRVVPVMSLDSTLFLERETSLLGKEFIQTLEPRLYYLNIPYRDQSAIPVFDSGLTDFNFAQVFAENRYSGYDRLNDANQLTGAVTTRFLNAETGVERFKAMIGQRYYFKQQRVTLPGETVRTENFSNVISAVTGLVAPKTYADAAWEFNYREHVSERFSLGMRFQPELGKVLSGSYRYIRDPLTGKSTVDQFDIAGQWPLSAKWFAVGRYNYSLRDKQMLEAIAGFEYNEGCWAVRLVGQRLEAIAGTPNTSVFFQLELNDFASIGANPIGLLRRTIPGYGKTNELPSSSQLLSNQ